MSKHTFHDENDEPMLRIRLADEAGGPLQAQQFVLHFSKLCRRLPADSEVWDLSNLLIDGQPVLRETVVAWLNKAHRTAFAEGEFQQQELDPCRSFTGLYQLLAFADAVDSTKALLNTCVAQLDGLQLHAQLGEQRLQLETDGRAYYFMDDATSQLKAETLATIQQVGSPAANEAEVATFKAQAAAQTEQLLFMAYKLQLAPLIERLHAFVVASFAFSSSIFFVGRQHAVFSERVLDAAVGDNRLGRQAWVDSVVLQHCGLVYDKPRGTCMSQLLEPLDLAEQQQQPLEFRAKLTRDFMGTAKGTVVNVKLDVLKSLITVGIQTLLLQPMAGQLLDVSTRK